MHFQYWFDEVKPTEPFIPKTQGEHIKYARMQLGLSQREFAKTLGCTKGEITKYESDRAPVTYSRGLAMAEALGVDPTEIFDDYLLFIHYPYSQRIKEIRAELNLSQIELSQEMGVYNSAVNRWECGREAPRRYTFPKIKSFCEENGISLLGEKYKESIT